MPHKHGSKACWIKFVFATGWSSHVVCCYGSFAVAGWLPLQLTWSETLFLSSENEFVLFKYCVAVSVFKCRAVWTGLYDEAELVIVVDRKRYHFPCGYDFKNSVNLPNVWEADTLCGACFYLILLKNTCSDFYTHISAQIGVMKEWQRLVTDGKIKNIF